MVINKPGQSNNNNGIDTVLLLRTGESLDIKILSLKPFLSRRRILMMVYVRAERKIELALHLMFVKRCSHTSLQQVIGTMPSMQWLMFK